MTAFKMGIDTIFSDPHLSMPVIWRVGGMIPGTPARVIRKIPEAVASFNDSRFDLPALLIRVRLSEVPDPQPGDLIEFVDEQNRVAEITQLAEIDGLRLVRTCEARYDDDPRFPATDG